RLAFAVAAHLDPEILIVDEVLAVGDTQFQQKCLKKIGSISQDAGKTVLFVSHNMNAVLNLCSRAILLENGRLRWDGDPGPAVNRYHSNTLNLNNFCPDEKKRKGDGSARFLNFTISPSPTITGAPATFNFVVSKS